MEGSEPLPADSTNTAAPLGIYCEIPLALVVTSYVWVSSFQLTVT